MTAPGELFITEDCTEAFRTMLDAVFGEESWLLDGSKFNSTWETTGLPKEIQGPILNDETEVPMGIAIITIKQSITEDDVGSYITVEPGTIVIMKQKEGRIYEKYG